MSYRFENLSILCVDDNKHMHQLFWISLSSMGFRKVKFASDGSEALELMTMNDFDIIFCDLNMAPMDGVEFLKTVRRKTGTHYIDIPVIIVSGNTEVRHVKEARDAGATEFLAKPISVKELYKRIEFVIENPRSFATSDDFAGPDRRRRGDVEWDGEDRRESSSEAEVVAK